MRKVTKPKSDRIPETTGQRITFLRTKAGQKQEELADMLHVTRNYITMIEADKRTPNADMLVIIAKHFKVTSDFLLGLSDLPCGSADDMEIEKRLGLLHTVIEKLERMNERKKNDWLTFTLNHLISSDKFLNFLYTMTEYAAMGNNNNTKVEPSHYIDISRKDLYAFHMQNVLREISDEIALIYEPVVKRGGYFEKHFYDIINQGYEDGRVSEQQYHEDLAELNARWYPNEKEGADNGKHNTPNK